MYHQRHYHFHLHQKDLALTRKLRQRCPPLTVDSPFKWHQRSMSRLKEERKCIKFSKYFRICPSPSPLSRPVSIVLLFFISFSQTLLPTLAEHNQHHNYIHYRYEQYLPSIHRPPVPTTATSIPAIQQVQQHNSHHHLNHVAQLQSASPSSLVATSQVSPTSRQAVHSSTHHQHQHDSFSISTVSPSTMLPHSASSASYHQMANYSGDLMIGAVFPIHDRDANYSCGQLQMESLQQMESLVYSLKRINDDPTVGENGCTQTKTEPSNLISVCVCVCVCIVDR